MNIGILTHPLINNYGGILQAYALSHTLKSMGHEVTIFKRQSNQSALKRFLRSLINLFHVPPYYNRAHQVLRLNINQIDFVNTNLKRTKSLYSSQDTWRECISRRIDAFIVGSDQVWRHDFSLAYGYDYFLGFLPSSSKIKRISYAASFGLESWNYTPNQTRNIKYLLQKFQGISVREYSGQELCKDNLGLSSHLVLDPTLLLTKNDYLSIMSPKKQDHYVFVYWLGDKEELNEILKEVDSSLKLVEINLRSNDIKPPIGDWLSYINYADLVITDSFHGCVFSIIFQKQFIMCCNKLGGYSRLESLFRLLEIEQKLDDPFMSIPYDKVQNRIKYLQEDSLSFLQNNLYN